MSGKGIARLVATARARDRPVGASATSQRPGLGVAVVACMDARVDVYRILGLVPGEAHVLRNAGGVVTADVIRSLAVSQRLLGTTEVLLMHHADCGMRSVSDDEFEERLKTETGARPSWSLEAFTDVSDSVRESMRRVRASPFLPHTKAVRGFVYDEQTGELAEVSPEPAGH